MAGVAVVTDSTASLGSLRAGRADIAVIPLQVVIDGISSAETDASVSPVVVAQALRSGRSVSTSRPSAEAFKGVYESLAEAGYDAIVSAHLSRTISGTCEAAEVAARTADIPVTVVDTATLAMASGFAVLTGSDHARRGASVEEVADAIRARARSSETFFYVDTLEYLRRGGRIGAAAAMLGSALAVKPLLRVADGAVQPYERVRTSGRALQRLEELGVAAARTAAETGVDVDVEVHHLDNAPAAERLVEQLRQRVSGLGDINISEVSAVLGVHVGPGTVGLVVSPHDAS